MKYSILLLSVTVPHKLLGMISHRIEAGEDGPGSSAVPARDILTSEIVLDMAMTHGDGNIPFIFFNPPKGSDVVLLIILYTRHFDFSLGIGY